MGLFSTTTPTGETRRWTLKEMIQGKPLGAPNHPPLVHFPIAFYLGALGLDVLSKLGSFPAAPIAATWLILGAFVFTILAAIVGLVDRSTTKPGSKVRKMVNRHMTVQLIAYGVFIVNLIIRWPDRHLPEAKVTWIVLDLIGNVLVTIGGYLGGELVYKVGMRVQEGP